MPIAKNYIYKLKRDLAGQGLTNTEATLVDLSTVSGAATLSLDASVGHPNKMITLNAGSGTYDYKVVLLHANATTGGTLGITFYQTSGAPNPTVKVYDGTASGTLMTTITPASGAVQCHNTEYVYNGTAWAPLRVVKND